AYQTTCHKYRRSFAGNNDFFFHFSTVAVNNNVKNTAKLIFAEPLLNRKCAFVRQSILLPPSFNGPLSHHEALKVLRKLVATGCRFDGTGSGGLWIERRIEQN